MPVNAVGSCLLLRGEAREREDEGGRRRGEERYGGKGSQKRSVEARVSVFGFQKKRCRGGRELASAASVPWIRQSFPTPFVSRYLVSAVLANEQQRLVRPIFFRIQNVGALGTEVDHGAKSPPFLRLGSGGERASSPKSSALERERLGRRKEERQRLALV